MCLQLLVNALNLAAFPNQAFWQGNLEMGFQTFAPNPAKGSGLDASCSAAMGHKGCGTTALWVSVCHAAGATARHLPTEAPSHCNSHGRRVFFLLPSGTRMTLVVAMGEAVAHGQGWKGEVWPWEENMGALDARVNFLLGKG